MLQEGPEGSGETEVDVRKLRRHFDWRLVHAIKLLHLPNPAALIPEEWSWSRTALDLCMQGDVHISVAIMWDE